MNLVIVMSAGAIKLSKVSRGVSVRVGESLDWFVDRGFYSGVDISD